MLGELRYDIKVGYVIGLYLILYIIIFYSFHGRYSDFRSVSKIRLSRKENIMSASLLGCGVTLFIILINLIKANPL